MIRNWHIAKTWLRQSAFTQCRNLLLYIAIILLSSCDDHGLSPVTESPGFGGTITVVSPWSPADSLFDLRVVAFREYPPGDILMEVASGNALISEPLELHTETQTYSISAADVTGEFKYIVVAQQYASEITSWRAVGVFAVTGDWNTPTAITLNGSRYISGVDMTVDFYDLPPQPF